MDIELKEISKEINENMWHSVKKLSVAESCTAGRISSVITAIPGSSKFYVGGLICYSNSLKEKYLEVDASTIEKHNVVSEEVAQQMCLGANKMFESDYAVAITGFAGPGGDGDSMGSQHVNVGTIWIAVGDSENMVTKKLEGDEGREHNLQEATHEAMRMLRDYLRENNPIELKESEKEAE